MDSIGGSRAQCRILAALALGLLFRVPIPIVSGRVVKWGGWCTNLFLFLFLSLSFDLFEFAHEFCRFIFIVVTDPSSAYLLVKSACGTWAYLSSSLLSESDPIESASISLVSSSILRLLASISSASRLAFASSSSSRLILGTGSVGASSVTPLVFAKCAASAANNSARRSRGPSASPPWPGWLGYISCVFVELLNWFRTESWGACKQVRVVDGRLDHEGPLCPGPGRMWDDALWS